MSGGLKHSILSCTLVCLLLHRGWSKGAAGGKGGARGNQVEGSGDTGPADVVNTGDGSTVKNVGKLANHNWLIYGPILVCICLITLCMMYDKIYRCYLSSKHKDDDKPESQVPALVIESPPGTVDHSKQRPNATVQNQANHVNPQTEPLMGGQTDSLHRTLVRPDQMGPVGLSDTERVEMTRLLAEKVQETARQYWISDHPEAIQADGIRLTDSKIYSDTMAQRLGLTSHSNTFTIGTQSGTLRLRTESPESLQLGAVRPEMLHLRTQSLAGDRKKSESDTSRADSRFETVEKQKLNGMRRVDRAKSESARSEKGRIRNGRIDARSEKETLLRTGDSEINNNPYHLLPTEDRSTG